VTIWVVVLKRVLAALVLPALAMLSGRLIPYDSVLGDFGSSSTPDRRGGLPVVLLKV
jgi:hypothetical protein